MGTPGQGPDFLATRAIELHFLPVVESSASRASSCCSIPFGTVPRTPATAHAEICLLHEAYTYTLPFIAAVKYSRAMVVSRYRKQLQYDCR